MSSAAIIPVFNEGERLLQVVEAAKGCSSISEVIVVNDGSTDHTGLILDEMDDITVIEHIYNRGKGEALDTGMMHAIRGGNDNAVFLDGDLRGINSDHIHSLLAPISESDAQMVIGYLGLRKAFVKKTILQQWGALSGQRAIRSEVWSLLSDRDKHGFNVEAALNARLRKQNLHRNISRVALDGVGHVGKQHKEPNWPTALMAYGRTYSAALSTYVRIELERTQPIDLQG